MAEFEQNEPVETGLGERLRMAREERGVSLEDVARQTRIPIRHLEHIEREEWESLPAITYSVGFARSYANAVGLDGAAIGAEVRQRLGGARSAGAATAAFYEPADPARVPPRSIAIVAGILAILLVAAYLLWRSSAVPSGSPADIAAAGSDAPAPERGAPRPRPAARPAAAGPVVLTAAEDVWLRIDQEGGGPALFMGTLAAGQTYTVPAAARNPRLRTGRANVLRVAVGSTQIPPLGPPERTISNVSLAPADLVARAQAGGARPAANPVAPAPTTAE
ncbi:MAG TPA: RodZ domain-containing protein [Allosphingosinicella sp.]|nr:RodZ domain-containing protein [Allosphingosinicella sp.]